jgi:hypothetical protein
MELDSLDSTWDVICSLLTPRPALYHWSAAGRANGYFAVTYVDRSGIGVLTSKGSRFVPRRDFLTLFPLWNDYCEKKILRHQLNFNVNTTYVLSTFHWLTLQANPCPNQSPDRR